MKKLDKDQILHFGLVLEPSKYGFKLDRSWYGRTKNKPTLRGIPDKYLNDEKTHYNDLYFKKKLPDVLLNFDLNMKHYDSLDSNDFNALLKKVTSTIYNVNGKMYQFDECFDVTKYSGCLYLMVLGRYKQIYIGETGNLPQRIKSHWIKNKEFDRLIFGGVNNSVLSIDSFRALDTTQIFVISDLNFSTAYDLEHRIVELIPPKFNGNRTSGGLLERGLSEAVENRKTREMGE